MACKRILNTKYRLGLFSDPYRGLSDAAPARVHLSNQHRDIAYEAAVESFVLLQNDWVMDEAKAGQFLQTAEGSSQSVLPLSPNANIAWIGPYIKDKRNLIGNWSGAGDYKQAISLWEALMNGRPLDLSEESNLAASILVTWFPGTQAGLAVRDVLFGKESPSGKLTMTFPRSVGQVPIYYNAKNTGRPFDEKQKYTSKYLDIQNTPLFAFGHGLSYGTTALGFAGISTNNDTMVLDATTANAQVQFDVVVLHAGGLSHNETIQLYTHQRSATFTRPLKELKGFQKIAFNVEDNIRATEHKAVTFTLGAKDFSYFNESGKPILEAGLYDVWIGTASDQLPLHKVVKVAR